MGCAELFHKSIRTGMQDNYKNHSSNMPLIRNSLKILCRNQNWLYLKLRKGSIELVVHIKIILR